MLNSAGGVGVVRVGAATETEMKEAEAADGRRSRCYAALLLKKVSSVVVVLLISNASKKVAEYAATLEGDEKTGAGVVLKALEAPLFHISANAGLEGAVIINKVRESEVGVGFDALERKICQHGRSRYH